MPEILSKGQGWRRRGGNPFESLGPVEWCRHCKEAVCTQVERGVYCNVYVYRKNCLRCGNVIQWGVDRHALASWIPSVMEAVKSWLIITTQDRR